MFKDVLHLLRYLVLPVTIVVIVCALFWETAKRYPLYVSIAVAVWLSIALIRGWIEQRRNRQRGWRVGHIGRDAMYYEELKDGTWHRIEVGGELLVGKAHHVIYLGPDALKLPEWAESRRGEIIGRIKSEFRPPGYEYDET